MGKTFSNEAQLNLYLYSNLTIALDNTMDILLTKLQSIIEDTVYGWLSPSASPWSLDNQGRGEFGVTSGQRTGQFLDSWQSTKSQLLGNMLHGEINQNIDIMKHFFVNTTEVHKDAENLANIINSGSGYNFGQAEGVPRAYWDQFMEYVILNLNTIFYQECVKLSLPIQPTSII